MLRHEIVHEITGNPRFQRESPCYDIIISQIRHVLAPEKSENEMCERFYLIIYARRSRHLENLNMWAHFEFLNSNISVFGHDFKPKMEISTDFSVIWRWYKRLVTAFSSFWVKIGGWCGSRAHGSRLKYVEISVFVQFRWVQNTWNIKK